MKYIDISNLVRSFMRPRNEAILRATQVVVDNGIRKYLDVKYDISAADILDFQAISDNDEVYVLLLYDGSKDKIFDSSNTCHAYLSGKEYTIIGIHHDTISNNGVALHTNILMAAIQFCLNLVSSPHLISTQAEEINGLVYYGPVLIYINAMMDLVTLEYDIAIIKDPLKDVRAYNDIPEKEVLRLIRLLSTTEIEDLLDYSLIAATKEGYFYEKQAKKKEALEKLKREKESDATAKEDKS